LAKKNSLEKELKYGLDRESYQRLLRACRPQVLKRDRLTTYYFDDRKLGLRRKKFGFRLRTNGGKDAKLTLKFPKQGANKGPRGFKVRHEFEAKIPLPAAKKLLKGRLCLSEINAEPVRILQRHFSDDYLDRKVKLLGSMKTSRTLAKLAGKFTIEIDGCEYFGKKFYELELETSRPVEADKAVRRLLAAHEIPRRPVAKSKLGRFLDEWEKRHR
jgi:uncharacterized protein YjbK